MTSAEDEGAFLDLVYGAAVDPQLWINVLERLADMVGAHPANLTRLSIDGHAGSGIGARIDPEVIQDYFDYYAEINPLHAIKDARAYVESWSPLVYAVEDECARDDYIRTEYFNDFVRPLRADWSLVIRLGLEDRAVSSILLGRPAAKGSYTPSEMDMIRRIQPHLIRAHALTGRLAETRQITEGINAALDRSPHALFVLDAGGRIRQANQVAERLMAAGAGLRSVAGRLTATSAGDAQRLQALVGVAASPDPERRRGGSMSLSSPGRRLALSVTVSPLKPEDPAMFTAVRGVLVCVSDPGPAQPPSVERLRALFGLTGAECRVALGLFEGLTAQEMAARFDVSPNTVRVQLGAVFGKTGVHRQAELVRLLADAVDQPG